MAVDVTGFTGPAAARDAIERAGCVMITGRNSGHGGTRPRKAAVQDLMEACAELERLTGLRAAQVLPSSTELEAMLKAAPPTSYLSDDGESFSVSFVQLHYPEAGLHALLAAGSGRKVDAHYIQPVLAREAEMFRSVRPGLIFSKRLDRLGRQLWGFGPLMALIEASGAWMGDETGLHGPDISNRFRVFMEAGRGEETADRMPLQTRRGMASRTVRHMVDGRASYHVAHPPPPGLVRLGMLGTGNSLGDLLLVLDSPEYLPHPTEVATGMPMVLSDEGAHVDQVANVRWALSVMGRPEWGSRAIVTELAWRKMSTASLRLDRGADATVDVPARSAGSFPILDTLLNNLQLYETGRLVRRLGVDGVDDVVIDGVVPTDGPWADPADFERIRAWLANRGRLAAGRRSLSLAGLPVHLVGKPARLISSAQRRRDAEPGYVVALHDEHRPTGHVAREDREPIITHEALAGSIVDAIAKAGHVPLLPYAEVPEGDRDLTAKIALFETRLEAMEAERRSLLGRITEKGVDGGYVLGAALMKGLNEACEELDDAIRSTAEERDAVKRDLEERRIDRRRANAGGRTEDLLRLVGSLRDARDMSYSALWLSVIKNLAVTPRLEQRANHFMDVVTWEGVLMFSDLTERWGIPFRGELTNGSGAFVVHRVDEVVGRMLEGTPFDQVDVPRREDLKREVAARFGVPSRAFLLGMCRDPRILRTASRLLLAPTRADEDVAREVGESVDFVSRLRCVYLNADRRTAAWLLVDQRIVAEWHMLAAKQGGLVGIADVSSVAGSRKAALAALMNSRHWKEWTRLARHEGYRLAPCPWCGGFRRAPMRIVEPDGLVCLDCRLDGAGLDWPEEPYDAYRSGLDLWVVGCHSTADVMGGRGGDVPR